MTIDETFDDDVGLAAGRQRITGTLEQILRFVECELQAERESEDSFFRRMIVFVVFDFGKMGFGDVRAMIELDVIHALFPYHVKKQFAEAGV